MDARQSRQSTVASRADERWLITVAGLVSGLIMVAAGAWAVLAPESLAGQVATFAPYNSQLLPGFGTVPLGLAAAALLTWSAADR